MRNAFRGHHKKRNLHDLPRQHGTARANSHLLLQRPLSSENAYRLGSTRNFISVETARSAFASRTAHSCIRTSRTACHRSRSRPAGRQDTAVRHDPPTSRRRDAGWRSASWRDSDVEVEEGRGIAAHLRRVPCGRVREPLQFARMIARSLTALVNRLFFFSAELARRVASTVLATQRFDLIFVHCSSVAPVHQGAGAGRAEDPRLQRHRLANELVAHSSRSTVARLHLRAAVLAAESAWRASSTVHRHHIAPVEALDGYGLAPRPEQLPTASTRGFFEAGAAPYGSRHDQLHRPHQLYEPGCRRFYLDVAPRDARR